MLLRLFKLGELWTSLYLLGEYVKMYKCTHEHYLYHVITSLAFIMPFICYQMLILLFFSYFLVAKYKPKTLDVPKPEPLTYHQRTLSDQSLSEEHHDENCFRSMNIRESATDSCTQSSDYAYNSLCQDSIEHKEINSVDDKSSLVSVHNICGSQLTQALKDKQYSKNLSWAD